MLTQANSSLRGKKLFDFILKQLKKISSRGRLTLRLFLELKARKEKNQEICRASLFLKYSPKDKQKIGE